VDALGGEFELFWEAMDLVYRDFYGEIPDPRTTTYNAIRGVVSELGDPNTSFLTPEEAAFFRSSMEGSFEGIGARVEWDEARDTVRIVEPFENQPAWRAGLKRGDLILAVDGQEIIGTELSEAIAQIRGPKDTEVTLTVEREGEAEPFDVVVTRDRVELPTISTDTLGAEGDIAYVRLYSFNQNAGQLVRQAVEEAMKRNPRALIFDLRGNTGGLLRQAVVVSSIFMEDQPVLIERFASGETESYATEGQAVADEIPLVVLVNEGSASASEIVAGALQDNGRAKLIGVTTFGKGSVQLPHTLSDGSIMRVTIARWYTPLDRSIDGAGLEPDLVVELSEEERTSAVDPQLEAAVEYLEQQIR
jgi:carboxyl-terminal processing protease